MMKEKEKKVKKDNMPKEIIVPVRSIFLTKKICKTQQSEDDFFSQNKELEEEKEENLKLFKRFHGFETIRTYPKDIFINQIVNKQKFKPLEFNDYLEIVKTKGKVKAQFENFVMVDILNNSDYLVEFEIGQDICLYDSFEILIKEENKGREVLLKLSNPIRRTEFIFLYDKGKLILSRTTLSDKKKRKSKQDLILIRPILIIENIAFKKFIEVLRNIYNQLVKKNIIPFGFIFADIKEYEEIKRLYSLPQDVFFIPINEVKIPQNLGKVKKIRYNIKTKSKIKQIIEEYLEGKNEF